MPQITLYFSKEYEDLVELAKVEEIKMSKIFIKTLRAELGLKENTNIRKLLISKKLAKLDKEREELKKDLGGENG